MKTKLIGLVSLGLMVQSSYPAVLRTKIEDSSDLKTNIILFDHNQELLKKIHNLSPSKFENKVFKNLNLSDKDLQGYEFINCTFINVNLKKSDLRNTIFTGSTFMDVFLKDALLCDDFKFSGELSAGDLVRLYANFVEKGDTDKSKALNGILGPLQLDLYYQNFSSLNLTGINLENSGLTNVSFRQSILTDANFNNAQITSAHKNTTSFKEATLNNAVFKNASVSLAKFKNAHLSDRNLNKMRVSAVNLNGIWLSDEYQLNYKKNSDVFYSYKNAGEETKPLLHQLINIGFDMFSEVPYEDLATIPLAGLDLHGAYLPEIDFHGLNLKNTILKDAYLLNTNLQGADLTGACLENVCLDSAKLQNTILTNANLNNVSLNNQYLQGVKLSDTLQLPDYQQPGEIFRFWKKANPTDKKLLLETLIHGGFPMFDGVTYEDLASVTWEGLDLRGANFRNADLHGLNFTGAILTNVAFSGANIENTNFTGAVLKGASFYNTKAQGANFTEANLEKAFFRDCDLRSAILINATLNNISIRSNSETFYLQKIKFSETVQFPDYKEINELYYYWEDANEDSKPFYQFVIHSGVPIFSGIPYEDLSKTKWTGKNLAGSNFMSVDLHDLDFTNTNFEGAILWRSNLKNADLTNANLENSILNFTSRYEPANLEGAILKDARLGNAMIGLAIDAFGEDITLPKNFTDADLIYLQSICSKDDDYQVRKLITQIIAGRGKDTVKQDSRSNIMCQIL